jgi:hypothetical protein
MGVIKNTIMEKQELVKNIKELQKIIDAIENSDLEHYIYCDALRLFNYQVVKFQERLKHL